MSGASSTPQRPDPATAASGPDPSMEDILASIRSILNEDEAVAPPAAPSAAPGATRDPAAPPADAVFVLDSSMMVEEPAAAPPAQPTAPQPVAPQPAPASTLVAPEAAATAASAVGALVQALVKERTASMHRGGPTIEDVVREELRPMLKAWLDQHLPPLVERLVRVEIERVVGRAAP